MTMIREATAEETCLAVSAEEDRAWRFVDSAEVQELQHQLNYGLLHPTEYAQKILAMWETFK